MNGNSGSLTRRIGHGPAGSEGWEIRTSSSFGWDRQLSATREHVPSDGVPYKRQKSLVYARAVVDLEQPPQQTSFSPSVTNGSFETNPAMTFSASTDAVFTAIPTSTTFTSLPASDFSPLSSPVFSSNEAALFVTSSSALSLSSGSPDDPQYSYFTGSHSLKGWQIALITTFAALFLLLLPCFACYYLRRSRWRRRSMDLEAHPNSLLDPARQRRSGRSNGQRSNGQRSWSSGRGGTSSSSSSRWGQIQTYVNFLSFGTVHTEGGNRTFRSWTTTTGTYSLSEPPPAYERHHQARRVSFAPSYRTHVESPVPPEGVPATALPSLRLSIPQGRFGSVLVEEEVDPDRKSPLESHGHGSVTPNTPTASYGSYMSPLSAVTRSEKL